MPLDYSPSDKTEKIWYKQFWPWFIIILPASVVVGSITMAVIAFKGADDLVVDNYYKEGLAINNSFDETRFAKKHHVTAQLQFLSNELTLNFQSTDIQATPILLLQFKHPLNATLDTNVIMNKGSDGAYHAALPQLQKGKWYMTLQPNIENPEWRVDNTVFLPKPNIAIIAD